MPTTYTLPWIVRQIKPAMLGNQCRRAAGISSVLPQQVSGDRLLALHARRVPFISRRRKTAATAGGRERGSQAGREGGREAGRQAGREGEGA